MLERRHLLIGQIFFFLFLGFFLPTYSAQTSTAYPLQVKYPNTMIYKAHTERKVIALTFDDGPDTRFTPLILDVLKKHNVSATFFLLGSRVQKYPVIAKRIDTEGHVIGNHTYWHPVLTETGVKRMIWEIEKNEQEMDAMIGLTSDLFRAPYGALTGDHVLQLEKMGYRGIGWSVDSEDWKSLPANVVKQKVLNGIHPGAIVLMHSAGHWTQDLTGTVQALDELIPYLKKQGYTFVTIPELWSIEHNH